MLPPGKAANLPADLLAMNCCGVMKIAGHESVVRCLTAILAAPAAIHQIGGGERASFIGYYSLANTFATTPLRSAATLASGFGESVVRKTSAASRSGSATPIMVLMPA